MSGGGKVMQIPILIETVANNGYRASSGAPLAFAAEGSTRDEAMRNLTSLLRKRLESGVEVTALEVAVPVIENPWVEFSGMFKDNPMFDDVLRIMEENRKRDEADTDYL
jgi:predicted RNase H-like HicB family nuclease